MKDFKWFVLFSFQPWFLVFGVFGAFGEEAEEVAQFIGGAYAALTLVACFIFGIHMVMSESANLLLMIYSWIGL